MFLLNLCSLLWPYETHPNTPQVSRSHVRRHAILVRISVHYSCLSPPSFLPALSPIPSLLPALSVSGSALHIHSQCIHIWPMYTMVNVHPTHMVHPCILPPHSPPQLSPSYLLPIFLPSSLFPLSPPFHPWFLPPSLFLLLILSGFWSFSICDLSSLEAAVHDFPFIIDPFIFF